MAYIGNSYLQQAAQPATDFFSGNGSTTTFTLTRPVQSVYAIEVVVNNVQQNPGSAYTLNTNNQLVLSGAPSTGTNNIYVNYNAVVAQQGTVGQGVVGNQQLGSVSNINAVSTSMTLQIDSSTKLTLDRTTGGTFVNGINVNGNSGPWIGSNYTSASLAPVSSGWARIARLGSGNALVYGPGDIRGQAEITIQQGGGNYSPGTMRIRLSGTYSGYSITNVEIAGDDMYGIRGIYGFRVTNPSDGYAYLEAYFSSSTSGGFTYISDTINFNVSLVQSPQPAGGGTVVWGPTPTDSAQNYRYSWNQYLNISRTGVMTTPLQPAFSMYNNANVSGANVQPFSGTKFNQGSYYDTTNYRFTAPVAGIYLFSFYDNTNGVSGASYFYFRKNGSQIGSYMYQTSAGGWDLTSACEVIKLAQNDYVDVYTPVSSLHADYGSNWGSFSGFLIG